MTKANSFVLASRMPNFKYRVDIIFSLDNIEKRCTGQNFSMRTLECKINTSYGISGVFVDFNAPGEQDYQGLACNKVKKNIFKLTTASFCMTYSAVH